MPCDYPAPRSGGAVASHGGVKGVARRGAMDIPVTVISPAARDGPDDAFFRAGRHWWAGVFAGVPAELRVLLRGLVSPGLRRVRGSVLGASCRITLLNAGTAAIVRTAALVTPNAVGGFRPDSDTGASSVFGGIGRCLRSSPCRCEGFSVFWLAGALPGAGAGAGVEFPSAVRWVSPPATQQRAGRSWLRAAFRRFSLCSGCGRT